MIQAAEVRAQQLLEANNRYVEINRKLRKGLETARDKFSFYAEQHWAKTHDANLSNQAKHEASVKARVNEGLVTEINDLLKETAPS